MTEVELVKITESIQVELPVGAYHHQPHTYPQLQYKETGAVVPDGIYHLSQNERLELCSVVSGQVRGTDWVDLSRPLFLA